MQAIQQLELEDIVTLTYNISEADAVIALHSKLKKNSQIQAVVKSQDIPVFFVKVCLHTCHLQDTVIIFKLQEFLFIVLVLCSSQTNSLSQITRALRALVDSHMDELIDIDHDDKEEARSSEETDALEVLYHSCTFTPPFWRIPDFLHRNMVTRPEQKYPMTVSRCSGGKAGNRASSDPERRERAATAEAIKHHLIPSGSRRKLQPQVGGHRPGA